MCKRNNKNKYDPSLRLRFILSILRDVAKENPEQTIEHVIHKYESEIEQFKCHEEV